jgi:hypothetical protein
MQHTGDRNVEDVAEDFLEKLIDGSLIQVATTRIDGGVKTYMLASMIFYETFAYQRAMKRNFLRFYR